MLKTLGPVPRSAEFDRILALPTREVPTTAQLTALAKSWGPSFLTQAALAEYRRTEGMPEVRRRLADAGMPIEMRPNQAWILHEFATVGGVIAWAPVGVGKTLASYLIALYGERVFGCRRIVLFVNASGIAQTRREFESYRRVWQSVNVQIVSYQTIGTPSGEQWLNRYAPDLVILDECDLLRNWSSARTARFRRYFDANPLTRAALMTGTAMRKKIADFAHLMQFALKLGAPVPLTWKDREDWSSVIDAREGAQPRQPGALRAFGVDVESIQRGFQRRIELTPGVVIIDQHSCDQPLHFRVLAAPPDPLIEQAFDYFRTYDETPGGVPLADPISVYRHANEQGDGFYYYWDPPPPLEWRLARKAFAVRCSEAIKASQRTDSPIDTEGMFIRRHPQDPIYLRWKAIEPTFTPNTVARCVSTSVIDCAAQWLRDNGPALVWVAHDWTGQALSALTGVSYYAAEGRSRDGAHIDRADPRGSAILSAHSNRRQRNLQAWNRNLVVGPEPSAERLEQLIGRTHRAGQDRPVFVDFLVSCAENVHALGAACYEAAGVQRKTKLPQKILTGTWDWSHVPEYVLDPTILPPEAQARWQKRESNND